MKAIKLLAGLAIVLVVLTVGVALFIFSNLNQIVKEVVETVGPTITETSVKLRDVDIKPLDGVGELNNFVIGNPQGFDSSHLLKWDTIRLQIDPASVSKDVIVIKDFTIEGANIIAEQKGMETNLQKLLDTLNSSSKNASETTSESDKATDVRLMLERLRFADNTINLVTEKFGSYTLDLPSFELSDIGDKTTGLTPEELGYAILKPLIKQTKGTVENRIKGLAKEELEAKLKEKEEELKIKAREKEEELKQKLDQEKAALDEKLEENEDKLEVEKEKLKGLFKKD